MASPGDMSSEVPVAGSCARVMRGIVTVVVAEATNDEPSDATPVATIICRPSKPAGIVIKAFASPLVSATVLARVNIRSSERHQYCR